MWLKKVSPKDTCDQMVEAYSDHSPSSAFVYKWFQQFEDGRESVSDLPWPGRPLTLEKVDAIKDYIEDNPAASCRCIARIMGIDKNTVKRILTENLHLRKVHFKWFPHLLTPIQKAKRLEISKELLKILTSLTPKQKMKLVTLDESWFYLTCYSDGIWTDGSERPQIPKRQISDEKFMFLTAFSTAVLIMIEMLPPKTNFNSNYMCSTILPQLKLNAQRIPNVSKQILVRLHFENARPHVSKMTTSKINTLRMKKLPQPPFSPDISPNDFFLYGYVKNELKGKHHTSSDSLLKSIVDIIEKIDESTWIGVYDLWIKRIKMVIDAHGEYLP